MRPASSPWTVERAEQRQRLDLGRPGRHPPGELLGDLRLVGRLEGRDAGRCGGAVI